MPVNCVENFFNHYSAMRIIYTVVELSIGY